ncbi:D-2-hydroxyacid dehydrogenase [Aureibacter tunicatorum]|uniref:Glycerate dehydrogenase n=1 Tax=Aureibacter tunicatorum TaxID=866807 RepID=A0AAE4BSX2_9BACT|nr:D-2-hydroxyacid dehydrogenase [Aureibacter tunicatorum]MDR6239350.1 glycerate dehydrogenase [Aureibacter tunicatorum]BDD04727.1 2-hydroxyacid dehydrogenase [Aureibacter tunicatorum]
MNIVLLDAETLGNVANLEKVKELGHLVSYPRTSPEQVQERIKDANIIITNKVVLGKSEIDAAENLKLICIAATGTNNIDLDYAKSRDIPVKNVAGYSTESVAQATFSMLLSLINHLSYYDEYAKNDYASSGLFTHIGPTIWELKGKRFGIIGLGNIGKRVAFIAQAFGCEVVYYSSSGKSRDEKLQRLELEELLTTSDIVTIHAPLNEKTKELIGKKELSHMKSNAILINVGRGGIVVESDLANALEQGELAGAGLDVFEKEPVASENPLLKINCPEKLIMQPHVAWSSQEARETLVEGIIQNILDANISI